MKIRAGGRSVVRTKNRRSETCKRETCGFSAMRPNISSGARSTALFDTSYCMKRKPSAKKKVGIGPTAVAKAAGWSKGLAHRLLARGLSPEQIIERVAEDKRRKQALADGRVNGHAATAGIPSFVESQTLKEWHLAQLRGIEVQSKRRDLLPLEPWLSVCFSGLRFIRQRLSALPDELGVEFGRTLAKVLHQRLEHIFTEARRVNEQECAKHGIVLPPEPPPPPVSPLLPYYQRYERGSTTGELENTSGVEQIGTPEWLALHPSVSFQESFQISARKKQWDGEMAALLNRRHEWDLPPEPPPVDPPPPEAA
jgi:hypothetical protein